MDVLPSILEYLRVPIKEEWDLDGVSRLKWASSSSQVCTLPFAMPGIALSGGYIFDGQSAYDIESDANLALD